MLAPISGNDINQEQQQQQLITISNDRIESSSSSSSSCSSCLLSPKKQDRGIIWTGGNDQHQQYGTLRVIAFDATRTTRTRTRTRTSISTIRYNKSKQNTLTTIYQRCITDFVLKRMMLLLLLLVTVRFNYDSKNDTHHICSTIATTPISNLVSVVATTSTGTTTASTSHIRLQNRIASSNTNKNDNRNFYKNIIHNNNNNNNNINLKKTTSERPLQHHRHRKEVDDEDHNDDDHDENRNDDNILLRMQRNERELYSYDDTYYSDVHFYSDDDGSSSSSSSSYSSSSSPKMNSLPSNIDWTSYALKYVSCANIKTWHSTTSSTSSNYDNDNNNDGTTNTNDVLVQHSLVVVRLCPATACSSYNVKGCSKDYGEYVLPASDYLQIIHTYYINQASIEKYCSVCSSCMSYVTNSPTTSPTPSPTVTTYDDFYNRHLSSNDDYFNDDAYGSSSYRYKPWYLNDSYQCMYQNVCAKYSSKCKKYIENNSDDGTTSSSNNKYNNAATGTLTNTTFGQCIAFRGDGVSNDYYYYYAAPHCAADGRTLHVGLYADPNCTIFVKSTGSSNPFASYTSGLSCLSCNYYDSSESSYALIPDTAIIQSNINDTSTLSTNHPLCSNLYNSSGHCNTRLTSTPFPNNNLTLSNYTAAEDTVVCPYIESLEDNMYDAYGDVILLKSSMYGLFGSFWRKGNGVASDEEVQVSQSASQHRTVELCLLFLSMCVFCSLSIHAYTLRKKLLSRRFISWTTTSMPSNDNGGYNTSRIGTTYDSMFPCWNDSRTNYKPPKLDSSSGPTIVRTESGIGITRSYDAPVTSDGSYDTETFVPRPSNTATAVAATTNAFGSIQNTVKIPYQPYGGTIPKRSNNNHRNNNNLIGAGNGTVVRFQNDRDYVDMTISNIPSLEYIDRNTGRFA